MWLEKPVAKKDKGKWRENASLKSKEGLQRSRKTSPAPNLIPIVPRGAEKSKIGGASLGVQCGWAHLPPVDVICTKYTHTVRMS